MRDKNLQGIGGWLRVVAAFQIIYIFQHLGQVLALLGRDRVWTPFAAGQLAGHLVLPILVIWCTVLLFRKRRAFPRLFIVQVWLIAGLNIVGVVWASARLHLPLGAPFDLMLFAWNIAFAAAGTLYMLKSTRVRNTFVT